MHSKRTNLSWSIVLILLAIMPVLLFAILEVVQPSAPSVPAPGSSIIMRGDQIIKIRNVVKAPLYEIVIEKDFRTIFYYFPESPGKYTFVNLNKNEVDSIDKLRQMWCYTSVEHEKPTSERYVEVGVRCSDSAFDYSVKQRSIFYNDLPEIIRAILQRVRVNSS